MEVGRLNMIVQSTAVNTPTVIFRHLRDPMKGSKGRRTEANTRQELIVY